MKNQPILLIEIEGWTDMVLLYSAVELIIGPRKVYNYREGTYTLPR